MYMKKYVLDLKVVAVEALNGRYALLRLTHDATLPAMLPGQFVEVRVDNSPQTMLRRPISIHYVDVENNELWLLVAAVGEGTRRLVSLHEGDVVNCVLPLGNGFSRDVASGERVLLVGGGVGVAPLLYYGEYLKSRGAVPLFLLGARSASDLLELERFRSVGEVYVTTEDGSMGEKGFVTNHSILCQPSFSRISTCGPKPMMVAVARYASRAGIDCEASLENLMACGLGACLCCVEKTVDGNLCVCKEGPVFNTRKLMWFEE